MTDKRNFIDSSVPINVRQWRGTNEYNKLHSLVPHDQQTY
jgi:hypothetical protein